MANPSSRLVLPTTQFYGSTLRKGNVGIVGNGDGPRIDNTNQYTDLGALMFLASLGTYTGTGQRVEAPPESLKAGSLVYNTLADRVAYVAKTRGKATESGWVVWVPKSGSFNQYGLPEQVVETQERALGLSIDGLVQSKVDEKIAVGIARKLLTYLDVAQEDDTVYILRSDRGSHLRLSVGRRPNDVIDEGSFDMHRAKILDVQGTVSQEDHEPKIQSSASGRLIFKEGPEENGFGD